MIVFSRPNHIKGILLLILTTVIWGTSFPLLKQVLQDLTPPMILAARFTIAAIAFIPYWRHLNLKLLRDGGFLGVIYFTECVLALLGLETISAHRSAFIISLNVILVPLLGRFLGRRLPLRILVAAGVAIVGIGVLSWEGGRWGWGDTLTLGCAVGIAAYILLLEGITPRHSALPLVAVQLGTMALLSLVWVMVPFPGLWRESLQIIKPHFNTLLYLGVVVSALPLWTQALAQRCVTASEAALFYTLEPVFASVFAFLWLGEVLGPQGFLGAALILGATVLSQFPDRPLS